MASSLTVITNTTPLINFAEIGCLRLAKDRGLIPAVAPLLDQLQSKARFWISGSLRTHVLDDAGEIVDET